MTILVTGAAGFIGYHLSFSLLNQGHDIVGIDNFNNYYDPQLKEARWEKLQPYSNFKMQRGDISDSDFVRSVFAQDKFDLVIHLAAQAGVRYCLENPHEYIKSNIIGFTNIIEEVRRYGIKKFIFASSSSVYGAAKKYPTDESFDISRPVSLYAATKAANELIAYDYYHSFGINCVGLRFFTVYGPFGRPDMAIFLFTDGIAKGQSIKVFNNGEMERDFTYIDDIVAGIIAALGHPGGYEIFNLGSGRPVNLEHYIDCIEKELGKKAIRQYLPMQVGDVKKSYANINKAHRMLGYEPKVGIEEGIKKYVGWYREYYSFH